MKTITKTTLSKFQIQNIVELVFGEDTFHYHSIDGGLFNQIYLLDVLSNKWILKVAPSNKLDVLTYENNIMENEVYVYQQFKGKVPKIPKMIYSDFSKSLIPFDYIVTEYIEGKPLVELWGDEQLEDTRKLIYPSLMRIMAFMHNVETKQFGYHNQQLQAGYKEVLYKMFVDVFNDGVKNEVLLPFSQEDILKLLSIHLDTIDIIKGSILHFDLWDGNILVKHNQITGIIDLERSFTGDPIAEFVPLHFDIFHDEYKHYIDVYNCYANNPIVLDGKTRIKYLIHKLYLRLIMVVECSYRDVDGSFEEQYNWAYQEIINIVDELKRCSNET